VTNRATGTRITGRTWWNAPSAQAVLPDIGDSR
jgi:hypothetical protein